MESVIKELFMSQIPDNLALGRIMCFGILRDAIKNMCEDLSGTFTEHDGGITAEVLLNNTPLHFHSKCTDYRYLIGGKFISGIDEEFFVIDKTNNKRIHLNAVSLIQAVDYDCNRIKELVKLNIKHRLQVYDRL